MNLAIACIALWLAQETPEATFRKIEEAYSRAKTVKITFSSELKVTRGKAPEQLVTVTGSLLLKGENKVRSNVTITDGKEVTPVNFRCDGATMQDDGPSREAVAGVRGCVSRATLRLGSSYGWDCTTVFGRGKDAKEQFSCATSNFRAGAKVGDLATLTFDVAHDGVTYQTTITYDPKTFKVSKTATGHTATDPASEGKAGVTRSMTETSECTFDGDISDDEFKPAPRKP